MVTLGAEVLTPRLAPEPPPTRLHMPLCRYPPAWADHSCLIKSYRQAAPFILLSAAPMLTLVESVFATCVATCSVCKHRKAKQSMDAPLAGLH